MPRLFFCCHRNDVCSENGNKDKATSPRNYRRLLFALLSNKNCIIISDYQ